MLLSIGVLVLESGEIILNINLTLVDITLMNMATSYGVNTLARIDWMNNTRGYTRVFQHLLL